MEVVREQHKGHKHITSRGELYHLCLGRIWDCKLHLHQKGSETVRVSNSISALNKAPQVLKSCGHRDISHTGMLPPGGTAVRLDLIVSIMPVSHFFVPTFRRCLGSQYFTLDYKKVPDCLLLSYSIANKGNVFYTPESLVAT